MTPEDAVGADPSFDRYARMVCRSLGVPTALVSVIEADRQVFPGASGLRADVDAARQTPLSHSFCQYVVLDQRPLVISDAREDERLRGNGAIADLGVIAYAGWPITDHTGSIVGSLCAIDYEPRAWSADDLEMLEDLAAACSAQLSERGLRTTEQDLSHRGRVLLALSEGLSETRTLADVARAVEQISLSNLGCLRAGMWLRNEGGHRPADLPSTARPAPDDRLTFVVSPTTEWESAIINGDLPLDDTNPLGATILTGRPQHFRDKATQNAIYPHLNTSHQIGDARSFVPLISRGTVLGSLVFLWEDVHELSEDDQLTIEALTSYAAQAVQRALLIKERLDALVTLQNSLLPHLPEPDHLSLAARYRPAASRDQVGGDWYDAVVMPSGATSLMVGDVVGHNIEAAAIMGQLRNMLRAIAWAVDDSPSSNVARLDQAMVDLTVDGMATLVYGRIEQTPEQRSRREWTLRWTNAGHPPLVLVSRDGTARMLDDGPVDLMLGVHAGTVRTDNRTVVEPGSMLLFYTDGLVERRGEDITEGLHRLLDVAGRHHDLRPCDFLDAILGELAPGRLDDDVAMLAVRFEDLPLP